ncbi:MAG: ATP-binding cassette domain-containing protein, partial [Planctomycetia bacterium]
MSELTTGGLVLGSALGPRWGSEQTASVLWRLRNVCRQGEQRPRLDSVSLEIRDVPTAVIGYSGAGKTTLLNILAGYEQPDSGVVERSIETVSGIGQHLAGGAVGVGVGVGVGVENASRMPLYWIPQGGGLWPHLTVRQHLLAMQTGRGDSRSGSAGPVGLEEKVDEILARLDLMHRKSAFPGEISEGERSRLSVARGLVSGARVLLMDEPLAHVDPVRKPGYWKVIRELSAGAGTTLVFSC